MTYIIDLSKEYKKKYYYQLSVKWHHNDIVKFLKHLKDLGADYKWTPHNYGIEILNKESDGLLKFYYFDFII
jgi:hypothetical protein